MKTFEELGATPAPWRVSQGKTSSTLKKLLGEDKWCMVIGRGMCDTICDCTVGWKDEEIRANAYLIAASPDLYEALRVLLETLDGYGFQPILADDPLAVAVKCGQIALAKAEGNHE